MRNIRQYKEKPMAAAKNSLLNESQAWEIPNKWLQNYGTSYPATTEDSSWRNRDSLD